MKIETLNFVTELYAKRQLPHIYTDISNIYSDDLISNNLNKSENDYDLLVVEDLPRYLKISRGNKPNHIKSYSLKQYSGFLINFKDVKSLSDYLNQRFGRTSRYKLRREQRKLEYCFNVSYKMHFGEMSKTEYDFVFEEFYKLLEIRSIEKGIIGNANLKYKDEYYKRVHQMIIDKEASFFVIYNGVSPIDICLNFHIKNTIFQYIRTYDVAYSKFNTGYTDLMKQIEWCIEKKVDSISFSKGPYYWKQRWCNTIYDYDYEVFYNKHSLKAIISATKFRFVKTLKQVTRELGVIEKYHNFKEQRRKALIPKSTHKVEILDSDEDFKTSNLIRFNYYSTEYNELRRLIYEFLYNYDEKEKDIILYKISDVPHSYLIKGNNVNAKVLFSKAI